MPKREGTKRIEIFVPLANMELWEQLHKDNQAIGTPHSQLILTYATFYARQLRQGGVLPTTIVAPPPPSPEVPTLSLTVMDNDTLDDLYGEPD